MDRDDALFDTPQSRGRPALRRALAVLAAVGALVALAAIIYGIVSKPQARKASVQQIALVRPPTPPPPPKPPEKPPEPPKVKEEVKIDQPKVDPPPNQPQQSDDKPASDKPLGVDADGGTGTDGFGLAANKGGRDFLSTGTGSRGVYYSSLLQRHFLDALSRNRGLLKEEFRVVVKIWLGDDGRVQRADIVTSSGNSQVDEQIQATLAQMVPLRDVPPASMRPMQLRLVNRS